MVIDDTVDDVGVTAGVDVIVDVDDDTVDDVDVTVDTVASMTLMTLLR